MKHNEQRNYSWKTIFKSRIKRFNQVLSQEDHLIMVSPVKKPIKNILKTILLKEN